MTIVEIKRVLKLGGSLAIILPTSWTKGKVIAGEEMVVISNSELRIFPVHLKDTEKQRIDTKNDTKSQQ